MAFPILPRREAIVDANGLPTLKFQVWWQAVTRAFADPSPGFVGNIRNLAADGDAVASDFLVLADATAAPLTVTLPPAADSMKALITVKKTDSSGHHVTVEGNGAETIDGSANVVLGSVHDAVTVACDGYGWWVL